MVFYCTLDIFMRSILRGRENYGPPSSPDHLETKCQSHCTRALSIPIHKNLKKQAVCNKKHQIPTCFAIRTRSWWCASRKGTSTHQTERDRKRERERERERERDASQQIVSKFLFKLLFLHAACMFKRISPIKPSSKNCQGQGTNASKLSVEAGNEFSNSGTSNWKLQWRSIWVNMCMYVYVTYMYSCVNKEFYVYHKYIYIYK